MRKLFSTTWLALAGMVALSGCDSDPVAPSLARTFVDVAGSYEATAFAGNGEDLLAAGGSLSMTLLADGSVTGMISIPAGVVGGPFDANLSGTYTLNGESVSFSQAADTFVRDAVWTWRDGVLDGTWSGVGASASARLERQ